MQTWRNKSNQWVLNFKDWRRKMTHHRTNSPCEIIYLPIMLSPSHLKTICKHPRNIETSLKKKLGNLNQSVISPLWEDLMNQLWKNFFKRNSLFFLKSLWLESSLWVIIVPIIDIIYMKLHIAWSWKIKSKISLIMA